MDTSLLTLNSLHLFSRCIQMISILVSREIFKYKYYTIIIARQSYQHSSSSSLSRTHAVSSTSRRSWARKSKQKRNRKWNRRILIEEGRCIGRTFTRARVWGALRPCTRWTGWAHWRISPSFTRAASSALYAGPSWPWRPTTTTSTRSTIRRCTAAATSRNRDRGRWTGPAWALGPRWTCREVVTSTSRLEPAARRHGVFIHLGKTFFVTPFAV